VALALLANKLRADLREDQREAGIHVTK